MPVTYQFFSCACEAKGNSNNPSGRFQGFFKPLGE
jgi:hypothetical protein